MLIPSIDLKNGKVVQLVQGERLAIASDDILGWVSRFQGFPRVQLIDLDAAMGLGSNLDIVRRICALLPCRVGGGIRSIERAHELLESGATRVILGSALFRDGEPDLAFAARLADSVGVDRVIAAVDSRGGQVVIKGWRDTIPLATIDAVRALDPYCAEFLYTHVDTEGTMTGLPLDAVRAVREATARAVTAAGGIRSRGEIDALHALGVDAVVGMAIYTGVIDIGTPPPGSDPAP